MLIGKSTKLLRLHKADAGIASCCIFYSGVYSIRLIVTTQLVPILITLILPTINPSILKTFLDYWRLSHFGLSLSIGKEGNQCLLAQTHSTSTSIRFSFSISTRATMEKSLHTFWHYTINVVKLPILITPKSYKIHSFSRYFKRDATVKNQD